MAADNVTLNAGSGGDDIAADLVSGAHYQLIKLAFGALDTASLVTSTGTNPLPVALSDTDNAVLDNIQSALDGTLTVGSHAVTNAGTFAVQVDGSALTALQLIDNTVAVLGTATYAEATTSGNVVGVVRNDTLATLASVDNEIAPLQVNASGALYIQEGAALDVSAATLTVNAHAVTNAGTFAVQIVDTSFAVADGNALGEGVLVQGDDGTDRKNINVDATTGNVQVDVTNTVTVGAHAVTNAGTFAVQISDTSFAVADGNALGEGVLVQGDDGTDRKNINVDATTGDVQVDVTNTVTVDLGANNDVTLNANSGVDIGDVDVTSISAGSNLVGDVGLSGARTSGGTTLYKNIDVDETEDEIKGTAGQVYWIHAMNLSAAILFLKFYNATAANVTVGTTTPDLTFPVPTQGDTDGAGFTLSVPNGIAFGTAITVAGTTGVADADTGAPGANELVLNLGYA